MLLYAAFNILHVQVVDEYIESFIGQETHELLDYSTKLIRQVHVLLVLRYPKFAIVHEHVPPPYVELTGHARQALFD